MIEVYVSVKCNISYEICNIINISIQYTFFFPRVGKKVRLFILILTILKPPDEKKCFEVLGPFSFSEFFFLVLDLSSLLHSSCELIVSCHLFFICSAALLLLLCLSFFDGAGYGRAGRGGDEKMMYDIWLGLL
jgi:hypothetical protein